MYENKMNINPINLGDLKQSELNQNDIIVSGHVFLSRNANEIKEFAKKGEKWYGSTSKNGSSTSSDIAKQRYEKFWQNKYEETRMFSGIDIPSSSYNAITSENLQNNINLSSNLSMLCAIEPIANHYDVKNMETDEQVIKRAKGEDDFSINHALKVNYLLENGADIRGSLFGSTIENSVIGSVSTIKAIAEFYNSKNCGFDDLSNCIENPIFAAFKYDAGDPAYIEIISGEKLSTLEKSERNLMIYRMAVSEEIKRVVLENTKNVNVLSYKTWLTVLHVAVESLKGPHCVKYFKMLHDRGANPNIRDKGGKTPLHYALLNGGNPVFLEYALNNMSEINLQMKDGYGKTPLHYAAENYRLSDELVALIIRKSGYDALFQKDNYGQTPMDIAKNKTFLNEAQKFINENKKVEVLPELEHNRKFVFNKCLENDKLSAKTDMKFSI